MTELEKAVLLDFINESFSDDKYQCELRLSSIEKKFLMKIYPNAIVSEMTANSSADKCWYKIKLN